MKQVEQNDMKTEAAPDEESHVVEMQSSRPNDYWISSYTNAFERHQERQEKERQKRYITSVKNERMKA